MEARSREIMHPKVHTRKPELKRAISSLQRVLNPWVVSASALVSKLELIAVFRWV